MAEGRHRGDPSPGEVTLEHQERRVNLAEQREAREGIERERQAVQGQLAEHRDRLQSLHGLLAEIQEQLRRGSDLTGL